MNPATILSYFAVGVINYSLFVAHGGAILFAKPKRRDGDARAAGIAEALVFVLLWPLQLFFWTLVGVSALAGSVLYRVMR